MANEWQMTSLKAVKPPSYDRLNLIHHFQSNEENRMRRRVANQIGLDELASDIDNSIITHVCLIINIALPIVQIIVGSLNKQNCQIEPLIPIWLVVNGVFSLIFSILKIIDILKKQRRSLTVAEEQLKYFDLCLSLHLLVWFVFGNIWVYSKWNTVRYDKNLDTNNNNYYCDQLTYLLAFSSLIYLHVCIALVWMLACSYYFVCAFIVNDSNRNRSEYVAI